MFKTTITGHVGRDPEMKQTDYGPVLEMSLAAGKVFDGETQWVTVSVWGKQAQYNKDKISRGTKVLVDGRIKQMKTYNSQKGPKIDIRMTASDIEVLNDQSSGDEYPRRQNQGESNNSGDWGKSTYSQSSNNSGGWGSQQSNQQQPSGGWGNQQASQQQGGWGNQNQNQNQNQPNNGNDNNGSGSDDPIPF